MISHRYAESYTGKSAMQETMLRTASDLLPKPESYKSALSAYLDKYRDDKHIDPNALTPAEQEQMRAGVLREIAERRGIEPEEHEFLLECFFLMKEESLIQEGGLSKLGVLVSRINKSPQAIKINAWLEAAKMSAEQTFKDLIKATGIDS